ncbi:MAG: hypothetical protein JNK64_38420 [Myxococcales bacterium]|nr:hypothetical protein [Myxococcales bacterium]
MPDDNTLPARVSAPPAGGAAAAPPRATGVFLGPGFAYEAVSQTSAMVVQDAASLLRQLGAVSTAALAVITEKLIQTEGADPNLVPLFNTITSNLTTASQAFVQVGNAAAQVMGYFQPGTTVPPPPSGGGGAAGGGSGGGAAGGGGGSGGGGTHAARQR